MQLIEIGRVSGRLDHQWRTAQDGLADLLRRRALQVAPDLDAVPDAILADMATFLIGGGHRRITDWFIDEEQTPLEDLVDHIVDIVMAVHRGLTASYPSN